MYLRVDIHVFHIWHILSSPIMWHVYVSTRMLCMLETFLALAPRGTCALQPPWAIGDRTGRSGTTRKLVISGASKTNSVAHGLVRHRILATKLFFCGAWAWCATEFSYFCGAPKPRAPQNSQKIQKIQKK